MSWVGEQVLRLELAKRRTLEVGSLNVNGSVRPFFSGEYLGVDMRPGPGVNAVVNAHDLETGLREQSPFELIVCTEMLEHDSRPWDSLAQMHAVATPYAVLLLSARGFDVRGCFPVHEYPADLWRFSCAGMVELLVAGGWRPELCIPDPEAPGVFAVAYA
jgi:hypothetical protein